MLKIALAYSMSSFFFGLFGVNWDSVDRKIQREYPAVQFISTIQLQEKYQSANQALPIIVDVREPAEFRVSHLEQALNLTTPEQVVNQVQDKNAPIVVYCSVGYRSAGIAAALQELGYTDVRNLRHSIFEWAENGYPLSNTQGSAFKVHPFNRAWGSLLDSRLHAYEP